MARPGRKSAASLAVVRPITDHRPSPPDDLTDEQAAEWRRIVHRMPSDWFPVETQPLLAALCRHIVLARRLAVIIAEFRTEWLAEDGGLDRLEQLAKMQDREHRAAASLSTKLRLTNQSRYTPGRAVTEAAKGGSGGKRPWDASA